MNERAEAGPLPPQRGDSNRATGNSEGTDGSNSAAFVVPGKSQRSRYIPAAVRREVFQRDNGCCTYFDERGERCCETHGLELHHLQPFAKDGAHIASNLTLRCAAHNALAAEEDFGRDAIAERRHATRHEALSRQRP